MVVAMAAWWASVTAEWMGGDVAVLMDERWVAGTVFA